MHEHRELGGLGPRASDLRRALVLALFAACGAAPAPKPATPATPPTPWAVPAGWKSEVIPFPLDFAPTLAHRGVEELRFAPGFFDPAAPGYWSYVFAWRLDDAAALDAAALGTELATYFHGLIVAVDDKHRIAHPDDIHVVATAHGAGPLTLAAHVFDAFTTGEPIELAGVATRTPCGSGALWVVTLAPPATTLRAELDAVAASAACGQPAPPPRE